MSEQRYDFLTTRGGPAFPSETPEHYCPGMSLRDYFAAQCLCSLGAGVKSAAEDAGQVAVHCYEIADAMLAAREAPNA